MCGQGQPQAQTAGQAGAARRPDGQEGGDQQQVQTIYFGHDRLTPHQRQEGEGQRRGDGGDGPRAPAPGLSRGHGQQTGGGGGTDGREQVEAPRHRAGGQQGEQPAQQDVGRVAGRMGHAQRHGRGDQLAAVAGPGQVAGHGGRVDSQGDGRRQRRQGQRAAGKTREARPGVGRAGGGRHCAPSPRSTTGIVRSRMLASRHRL